jgi:hypothetical protein
MDYVVRHRIASFESCAMLGFQAGAKLDATASLAVSPASFAKGRRA